jgi:MFS family permease
MFTEIKYRDLLKKKSFFPFFISQIMTNFGDGLFAVLLVTVALAQGASPTELGIVTFCTVLPRGLLGPIGGVFGDRMDKKRLMIIVEVARTLAVTTVPILFFVGDVSIWFLP